MRVSIVIEVELADVADGVTAMDFGQVLATDAHDAIARALDGRPASDPDSARRQVRAVAVIGRSVLDDCTVCGQPHECIPSSRGYGV